LIEFCGVGDKGTFCPEEEFEGFLDFGDVFFDDAFGSNVGVPI